MKLTSGTTPLELPDYIKMGMEIEVENVSNNRVAKGISGLKGWKVEHDGSLTDHGAEIVSPVLDENKNPHIWEDLSAVCAAIDANPHNAEKGVYADHTCGGHIHFDAKVFESNPEVLANLLRIWGESEELVYKMCNDQNDPIRDSALRFAPISDCVNKYLELIEGKEPDKKDKESPDVKQDESEDKEEAQGIMQDKSHREFKIPQDMPKRIINGAKTIWGGTLTALHAVAFKNRGFAFPNGQRIKDYGNKNGFELRTVKKGILKPHTRFKFNKQLKAMTTHYSGLNLQNIDAKSHRLEKIGKKKINTVEFRISNGSKDPRVWKENAFLYASIIQAAYRMTYEPEKMEKKVAEFYKSGATEEDKVNGFLGLIMDHPEDRDVYKQRWESVKDNEVFHGYNARPFAKNTFKKDDFENATKAISPKKFVKAIGIVKDKAVAYFGNKAHGLINDTVQSAKENDSSSYEEYSL